MNKESATVISLHGGRVDILMQRQSSCSHCELSKGCGTGAIGRLIGLRSKPVSLVTSLPLKIGDELELGLPESSILKASLLIYGFPILGLIGFAITAEWLFSGSELFVFVFASIGLVFGFSLATLLTRLFFSKRFDPIILTVNNEPKS